jgi:glycosyltransferase involved in cell wall biosynthesis
VRLLSISPAPLRGGAEEYALTIATAARAHGWTVLAGLPAAEGTRTMVGDLARAGIRVGALPCIDPWLGGMPASAREVWSAACETAGLVRAARPDVVHLTLAWPAFGLSSLLAPALVGVPAVVVFQLVPEAPELQGPSALYRLIAARRQRWVAVSQHGRAVIAQAVGVAPRSIEVIHNGVAAAERAETRDAAVRAAVRGELGVPPDSRLVVSVGRLHEQKAHADLCRATVSLLARHADVYVAVAGEGPERAELERLTDALALRGRMRWLGRRDDVPRLLAAADVFAFPSRFEGLPFALAEAMAAGVPVVTAAFPGADELVRHREQGLLVEVGDVPALADGLAWALEHPEAMEAMARAARDRVRGFSRERMIERTLALLARSAWAPRGTRLAHALRRQYTPV